MQSQSHVVLSSAHAHWPRGQLCVQETLMVRVSVPGSHADMRNRRPVAAAGQQGLLTDPISCEHLTLQGVAQHCKAPQLVGDVLGAQHRYVHHNAVVDEVKQLAVADVELG